MNKKLWLLLLGQLLIVAAVLGLFLWSQSLELVVTVLLPVLCMILILTFEKERWDL